MSQHFLQTKYWKEVKERLGNKTYAVGMNFFQTTKLPYINKYIGYMPRPDLNLIDWNELYEKAKKANCINIVIDADNKKKDFDLNLFTKNLLKEGFQIEIDKDLPVHLPNTIFINLEKKEEDLLKEMKPKHRYNLKLAQKKEVLVKIEDSEEAFQTFLKLYNQTFKRQKYFGRNNHYLETVWEVFKNYQKKENKELIKIATAFYKGIPLVSWMLIFNEDVIYYPYGGSSDEYKNVMAPYALVWEIVKYGKEKGYKYLDLFGIKKDSSDGYSRFKVGFGGEGINYVDAISLIIDKNLYLIYKVAFKLRKILKFGKD